jgi:hypothetical protein
VLVCVLFGLFNYLYKVCFVVIVCVIVCQDANSLHFRGKGPSEYEQAIRAVGEIVGRYDHDQLFPTYGFGAK